MLTEASFFFFRGGDSNKGKGKQDVLEKRGRFNDICNDQRLYKEFETFLTQEYAQENLWFYRDVVNYETTNWEDKDAQVEAARAICDKYLGTGSVEPLLYISLIQLKKIEEALKAKEPDTHLFDRTRIEVEGILKTKYLYFSEL